MYDYSLFVYIHVGASLKSEPVEVEGGVLLPYNLPPDRYNSQSLRLPQKCPD